MCKFSPNLGNNFITNSVEILFLFPQRLHSPLLARNNFLYIPDMGHILLALQFLGDHATWINAISREGHTSMEVLSFQWEHLKRCSSMFPLIHLISDSLSPCQDPFITFWLPNSFAVVAVGQKVSDFQSVDHILRERNHPSMHSELDCLLSCWQSTTVPVATHTATQLEKKHWENIYSLGVIKKNGLTENRQNKPVFQNKVSLEDQRPCFGNLCYLCWCMATCRWKNFQL